MKVRQCDKWWCSDVNPSEYMEALAKLWSFNAKYFASESPSTEKGPLASFDLEGMTKASKAFTTLWSSAMEVSQTLARHAQEGKTQNPLITELLGKFLDPKAWFSSMEGMDQALQQLSEGPRLADLWDTERKMLNVFNAWAALRQRSLEHNTIMLEAWLQAAGKLAENLNKRERTEALGSWRELLALWVETANTVLLETQRSDAYLKSQREILKTSTDLRLAQQEIAAFYSETFGYPTRAELDDVHRTVTELRRELRALQRANREAPKHKVVPKPRANRQRKLVQTRRSHGE